MSFKFWKLVDSRILEDFSKAQEHLICDIDKTYLETSFDSMLKLAQIPFEKARAKITVSGAKDLLQAYRQSETQSRPLHFVSASPPQLRSVISEKLRWDGLTWSSDTFKNQAYNLRKGRFNQFRRQVAYKTAAILNLLTHAKKQSRIHMIGDNAESDSIIYLGCKLFTENRLSRMGFLNYLRIFGVTRLESLQLLRHCKSPDVNVASILIRRLDGKISPSLSPLTDPILYFDNFYEAALYLFQEHVLDIHHLSKVSHVFHKYYGISTSDILHYLNAYSSACKTEEEKTSAQNVLREIDSTDAFLETHKDLKLIESKNLDAFYALTEDDILNLAKEWKLLFKKRRTSSRKQD